MAFFKEHITTHKKKDQERKDKMQNQTYLFKMLEIATVNKLLYACEKSRGLREPSCCEYFSPRNQPFSFDSYHNIGLDKALSRTSLSPVNGEIKSPRIKVCLQ